MSTRELREPLKYSRSTRRRRSSGIVDLNVPPPSESTDEASSFAGITAPNGFLPPSESRDRAGSSASIAAPNVQGGQSGGSVPPAPIDLEAIDDDVIISSPTAFAQAKNNSRRAHGRAPVVDLESDDRPMLNASYRNKRRRVPPNQTVIICDSSAENDAVLYEMGSALLGLRALDRRIRPNVPQPPPPPPPPPPEPTFSCPVCMGPLVEEMTTKCGHIFCKQCIKASISSQSKCPTCRRKVTMKDIIRVYLPTTK